MKTKLSLFIAALAFTGISYGGPSDAAAFAVRSAREAANRDQGQSVVVANDNNSVNYVPSSSGKGVVQSGRDEQVTNIALFKSKTASANGAACCTANAKAKH